MQRYLQFRRNWRYAPLFTSPTAVELSCCHRLNVRHHPLAMWCYNYQIRRQAVGHPPGIVPCKCHPINDDNYQLSIWRRKALHTRLLRNEYDCPNQNGAANRWPRSHVSLHREAGSYHGNLSGASANTHEPDGDYLHGTITWTLS